MLMAPAMAPPKDNTKVLGDGRTDTVLKLHVPAARSSGDWSGNPFVSTPSSLLLSRTLLVTAILLLVALSVSQVVQAAPSASASAAAAAAAAAAAMPAATGIERPDGTIKRHHYGITSASAAAAPQHHAGPSSAGSTSTASSSLISAAALVSGGLSSPASSLMAGPTEKPYFDDINSRNVTTVVDDTAILKCRVKHKGDRTVSWMRKRDLHILTSNIYTYTGDQRFSVIHPPDSDDWDLKIEYAQQKDSGIYECQVNTEPKINLAVYLDVTAARAKIIGSQEVHVKKGSTISLSCVVNVHASSISWFHGSSIVDFDSARGGISLETEKTEGGTSSRLMLTRATLRDSGNYTCVPTGAISASVQVHVLNGEHPAAMQTSSGVPCPTHQALILLFVTLNSCNCSKLIFFISNLLETVRFLFAATIATFLFRVQRLADGTVALLRNGTSPSTSPSVHRQAAAAAPAAAPAVQHSIASSFDRNQTRTQKR
ncbi:hemicentin-2-like isoform X3 [Anopheles albimanus]|uniref:hemicentin-2-like isoform X3 n=1 Tax=Anopheles albimanus TaxID=7167 RepID=UPI00163E1139|nr:hemicentin-2-like isoform X3 [Anopheles albimanus]